MYGFYNDGVWGGGNMMSWFGGGLMMIVFWALIVMLIVWLVREISGRHSGSNSRVLDILKERYAKGEISKEQFVAMKEDIK